MRRGGLPSSPLRIGLLMFCGLAGLTIALAEILTPVNRLSTESALRPGVIAQVGTTEISWRRYQDVLSDLRSDRRSELSASDRKFALQRLIDEQLLIDRGLELKLDASVPAVRKSLASAVIAQISAESNAANIEDQELRDFYHEEKLFFAQPTRYAIRWYRLRGVGENDLAAASILRDELLRSLNGEVGELTDFSSEFLFENVSVLPQMAMPVSTLSSYLGSNLAGLVETLSVGAWSKPMYQNDAWHLIYSQQHIPQSVPEFEALKPALLAELKRRHADAALKKYLSWLAKKSDITIDSDFE